MVLLVDDVEILVHVPQVACYEGFELCEKHGHGLAKFLIVLRFHFLFFGLAEEFVDYVLWHLVLLAESLEGWVLLSQLSAVLVDVAQTRIDDEAFGSQLAVEMGVLCGVEGNEEIGHDASSTVDGAMETEGFVAQGVVEVDAVDRIELAMSETFFNVFVVVAFLSFHVGFLNAATGRCIVMGNGESHHGTVGKLDGPLYESFSEGASTDNLSAVLILECASDNFGSGG